MAASFSSKRSISFLRGSDALVGLKSTNNPPRNLGLKKTNADSGNNTKRGDKMSQASIMYELLSDCEKHRTDEILDKVYGLDFRGVARIASRVHEIRTKHSRVVNNFPDPEHPSLTFYQMEPSFKESLFT